MNISGARKHGRYSMPKPQTNWRKDEFCKCNKCNIEEKCYSDVKGKILGPAGNASWKDEDLQKWYYDNCFIDNDRANKLKNMNMPLNCTTRNKVI